MVRVVQVQRETQEDIHTGYGGKKGGTTEAREILEFPWPWQAYSFLSSEKWGCGSSNSIFLNFVASQKSPSQQVTT